MTSSSCFLLISDDGPINGGPPPSFVNMTVELLEGGKIMNVKLGVTENESKLSGALGNTLTINVFNIN